MTGSSRSPRRVVITGMGVHSPLGSTPEAMWQALSAGQSGIRPLELFPASALPVRFAGEVKTFRGEIEDFGPIDGALKRTIRKGLKTLCREARMGIAAAQLALHDAGLKSETIEPERTGVVYGSDYMITLPEEFSAAIKQCLGPDGRFDFSRWGKEGREKMDPLWLLKYLPNMPGAYIAIYNDLRGPNNSLTLREASSNLAIGEAFRYVQRNHADVMVAGATGTWVHPLKTVHALLQQEMAVNGHPPEQACRPFDRDRHGMVVGEGAGAIILEEFEHAQARGAKILAEVVGAANCQVASKNLVGQRDVALAHVMRGALRDAGATPEQVGHIQAHGLGTQTGDIAEAAAIHGVFGPLGEQVPVAAAKSYFGNLGAGSGAVELIAGVLCLQQGRLFRTLNHEHADPACRVNVITRDEHSAGGSFLNVNVTLQGQASCVMVRAV